MAWVGGRCQLNWKVETQRSEKSADFSHKAHAPFAALVPLGFVVIGSRLGVSICFDGNSLNGLQLYRRLLASYVDSTTTAHIRFASGTRAFLGDRGV